MISADQEMDEYIKMELSPEPEPIPQLSSSLARQISFKDKQHTNREGVSSLGKEDPFSALDATSPLHTVENIYEHIQ